MIRKRYPHKDDPTIFGLIRRGLIPLTPQKLKQPISDRLLTKRLSRGVTYVWSGRRQSGVTGFITVIPNDSELFVDMLAVDPAFQGRGIGSALLHEAEQVARGRGCSRMSLYVNNNNMSGIRFYQKHGMQALWYDPLLLSYMMQKGIA